MIGDADVAFYRAQGYLVVPDVLSAAEVARLGTVTDTLVAASAAITEHTDLYDLDDLHRPEAPRVRRLKTPHLATRFLPTWCAIPASSPSLRLCGAAVSGSTRRSST